MRGAPNPVQLERHHLSAGVTKVRGSAGRFSSHLPRNPNPSVSTGSSLWCVVGTSLPSSLATTGFKWIYKCTPISSIKYLWNKFKRLTGENGKGCLCLLPWFPYHLGRIKRKDAKINCFFSLGADSKYASPGKLWIAYSQLSACSRQLFVSHKQC